MAHPSSRRYWRLLALGLLVSAGPALSRAEGPAPEQTGPTVYALIAIEHSGPGLLPGDGQPRGRAAAREIEAYRRTQAVLIKSRLVLTAALRSEGVGGLKLVKQQTDPVAWLEENLKVDFPGNATLLRVSMRGERPEERAAVVNAVAKAYLQEAVGNQRQRLFTRLDELDRAYQVNTEKLRQERDRLRRLAEALGATEAGAGRIWQQVVAQEYADVRKELRAVRLARASAKARLGLLPAGEKDERAKKLKEERAVLEAQEELLAAEVERLEKQVKEFEQGSSELEAKRQEIAALEGINKRLREERERRALELQEGRGAGRALPRGDYAVDRCTGCLGNTDPREILEPRNFPTRVHGGPGQERADVRDGAGPRQAAQDRQRPLARCCSSWCSR